MVRMLCKLLSVATLALLALMGNAKEAPSYPSRPIRLIAPGAPGSPPDLVARIIGEKLSAALAQTVVVENRPGGGGTIGLDAAAKSTPDGHTLGIVTLPSAVAPSLVAKMPYDTEKDLTAVTLVVWSYNILAVPAASPAKSVANLVALAKAKPGALKFSSGGNATPAHLAGELFKREAGVDLVHVPYKGAPAGALAVVTGDIDMMIGAAGPLSPHIRSGKLRALATSAPHRIKTYPELPTFIELGYRSVEIRDWAGVVAPARTPKDVIARLHAEISRATATPDVKQRFEAIGMEATGMGPREFAAHIRDEIRKWGKVVRDAGIKAD